jgi:hypothetical protein
VLTAMAVSVWTVEAWTAGCLDLDGSGVRVFSLSCVCWAVQYWASCAAGLCSRLIDGTGNRTETTVLFRFLGLRDRTGTDFFGSSSFNSGSQFFRFGSRFPVLCAQSE